MLVPRLIKIGCPHFACVQYSKLKLIYQMFKLTLKITRDSAYCFHVYSVLFLSFFLILQIKLKTNLFQLLRSTGSYTIGILNNLLAVELTQDVDVEQEPLVTFSYFIKVPEVKKMTMNFLCGCLFFLRGVGGGGHRG